MINLLPPNVKQEIKYGRKNAHLLRQSVRGLMVVAGLAVVSLGGYFYIDRTAATLQKQIDTTKLAIEARDAGGVREQAEEIAANTKLITQVLSKHVLFSKLLKNMGAIMPSGSVLTQISVEKVEGGLSLSANARNATIASQVQVNLSDPANKLFDKVDIVGLDCTASESTDEVPYPCTVTLRALFVKNNPFYFGLDEGEEQS